MSEEFPIDGATIFLSYFQVSVCKLLGLLGINPPVGPLQDTFPGLFYCNLKNFDFYIYGYTGIYIWKKKDEKKYNLNLFSKRVGVDYVLRRYQS